MSLTLDCSKRRRSGRTVSAQAGNWAWSCSWNQDDGRKFSRGGGFPPITYPRPFVPPEGSAAEKCCRRKCK